MDEKTDKNTRISFNFGAGKKVPFTATIENLSFIKIEGGNNATEPDKPVTPAEPVDNENLCASSKNWGRRRKCKGNKNFRRHEN